jgi:hypothetical protein
LSVAKPITTARADGSHVRVALFIVNNNPETMDRLRPHVQVGSRDIGRTRAHRGFVSANREPSPAPHAEEPRLQCARRSSTHSGAASRSMRALKSAVADLSTQFCRSLVNPRSVAAPSFETAAQARADSRLVAEPLPCRRISRCQTAHVLSFPRVVARGLALLSPTGSRGGRSAHRRIFLSLSRLRHE